MKKLLQYFKKLRSIIALVLVTVSLLMTSSTFAYWTSTVEGNSYTHSSFIHIGEYGVKHPLFLLSTEYATGDYKVINRDYFTDTETTHTFTETFEAEWINTSSYWIKYYIVTGQMEIDYEIRILKENGKEVNKNTYKRLIDYIEVTLDESNPTEVLLNDEPQEFGFTLEITEPTKNNHYKQLEKLTVSVVFTYEINGITYEYIYNK